jgi:uncharacterized membrane protein YhfC
MPYIPYFIKILFLAGLPIALGIYLVRKFDLEGRWWWIALSIYFISQIILQPLENGLIAPYLYSLNYSGVLPSTEVLIFGGLLIGLCVGFCEELLRYSMYRWWAKDARSFKSGLLLGIGHGGAASIFLAFQVLAYWTNPGYYSFPVVIGQILMIAIQVCLAIIVLQAFSRKQGFWILLAIGFHALVEATRVIALNMANEYVMIAILGAFTILSIIIILSIRRSMASSANVKVDAAPPLQNN